MLKKLPLVVIVGVFLPAAGFAQSASDLRVGTRARIVTAGGDKHTGTLTDVTENSITLVPKRRGEDPVALSMTQVSRVQVSAGRNHAKGALIGGLTGFGVGAAAGAMLGAMTYQDKACSMVCFDQGASAVLGGVLLGGVGLVVGTISGGVKGREKWADVPQPFPH